jgi:hypothetical protein
MGIIALVLLVALLIPIMGIVMDSPVGRALARRLEGGAVDTGTPAPAVHELARKVELLESEVDDLARSVDQLHEENEFLQRLLEEGRPRPTLPPPPAS